MKRVIWGLVIALAVGAGVYAWMGSGGDMAVGKGAGKSSQGISAVKGPGKVKKTATRSFLSDLEKQPAKVRKEKIQGNTVRIESRGKYKRVDGLPCKITPHDKADKKGCEGIWSEVEPSYDRWSDVEVRFVDWKGRPLPCMGIQIVPQSGLEYQEKERGRFGRGHIRRGLTDENGYVHVKRLIPARAYVLTWSCAECTPKPFYSRASYRECRLPRSRMIWAGDGSPSKIKVEDIVFHKPYHGVLEGRILSRTTGKTYKGKIQDICMDGTSKGGGWRACWGRLMGLHLKEGGKYRIENLPPGVGTLSGIIYGAPWPRYEGVKIKKEGVTEFDIVIDDRPQGFYGYVRDKDTGKVVTDATVDVEPKPGIGWGGTLATSETNKDGMYIIKGIPPGLWTLSSYNMRNNFAITVMKDKKVEPGKMTKLDIYLQKRDTLPASNKLGMVEQDPHPVFSDNSCSQQLRTTIKSAFNAAVGRFGTCIPTAQVTKNIKAAATERVDIKCLPGSGDTDYAYAHINSQGHKAIGVYTNKKGTPNAGTGKGLESTMFHELSHLYGFPNGEADAYAFVNIIVIKGAGLT